MDIQARAQKLGKASPLIERAIGESSLDEQTLIQSVEEALEQLNGAQLLHCFSVLLDEEPTSETFATARSKTDQGRRDWLLLWLRQGDFWPDDVLDAAYGC